MNSHIPTLLLREWMQHKRGWLIAPLAPPLLVLALLPVGHIQGLPMDYPEVTATIIATVTVSVVYAVCLLVALFQLPGLARRDVQDRSIEFWLSLPGRPSESVAATALAHAWLAPLGGALIGTLFGLPVAASIIASKFGLPAAAAIHWGDVAAACLPMLLRMLAGSVLLMLWLAPVVFALMAASAWLKRLGVPLVLVGVSVGVTLLHKVYDIHWPQQALSALGEGTSHALIYDAQHLGEALKAGLPLGAALLQDFGRAAADLASLSFLGWAAVAAAGFALVVAKRSRGG